MDNNNAIFKHICANLKLKREDVFDIMDGSITKSQITRWFSGPKKVQHTRLHGKEISYRRMKTISENEFDQFCSGLLKHMGLDAIQQPTQH